MGKKIMWVLLGIALAAGAVFLATDRHYWDPQRSTPRYSSTRPNIQTQRTPSQNRSAQAPASTTSTSSSTTMSFDTIINILNVIVGVLGIWMTIHGMRMQRAALMAASRSQR